MSTTTAASPTTASLYRRLPLVVKRLSEHATLPQRGSEWAAGLDLASAVALTIPVGERALVATDLSIACPPGTYGRVAPRSGLALKHGIDVGAGVIDADYRGPVGVILFNWGQSDFEIKVGDRIAQLILEQIVLPDVVECPADQELDSTERGQGGFGSTGIEKNQDGDGAAKKQRTISPGPPKDPPSQDDPPAEG
jgi:dUTP pyrophosphatase